MTTKPQTLTTLFQRLGGAVLVPVLLCCALATGAIAQQDLPPSPPPTIESAPAAGSPKLVPPEAVDEPGAPRNGVAPEGAPSMEQHSAPAASEPATGAPAAHGESGGDEAGHAAAAGHAKAGAHGAKGGHAEGAHGEGGHAEGPQSPFTAHHGTWFHWLARAVFGQPAPVRHEENGEVHFGHVENDFIIVALLGMVLLGLVGVMAGKKARLRPEGGPMSLPNLVEASLEGFRNYLIGVMGRPLGMKYAPLISSFFFTILMFNWMGLIPGMVAPTANPNIPIGLSIVGFFAVHIIAIREAGVKSWFMHFVGEPKWLAPLNFPLHILGEFIKPMSLSIRLLCNVFGEEMVAATLAGLAVLLMATIKVPVPFQLPMLMLGVFFGLLQALVYSTLLAIYISILATHHDDHDEHNAHGHVEHVHVHGFDEVIAHPSETPVA